MDIYSSFRAINACKLEVLKSINTLTQVEEPETIPYVRLEESPFIVSEETKRVCQVVSAHDLYEYRNRFYSIKLQDDMSSWLLDLLKIDEERV